jgi:RNA polymerase sigma-70 factor (ECF subfamily)
VTSHAHVILFCTDAYHFKCMNIHKSTQSTLNRSSLSDKELVYLYRREHDMDAFKTLFNRYESKIYSYIYSMVLNTETANDLFQDTFTKVIMKMEKNYNEEGKWIAWVMRIAHNATIDYLRRAKKFVHISSSSDGEENTDFFHRVADEGALDASQVYVQHEDKKRMYKHISRLPEEQRAVVMLRHYEELSFKEIAEITGVSINTALGRMRYALTNLRKYFEEEQQSEKNHAS